MSEKISFRVCIIHQGQKYSSEIREVSQKELDQLKEDYTHGMGDLRAKVTFHDMYGIWYCFPPQLLQESILCIEIMDNQ